MEQKKKEKKEISLDVTKGSVKFEVYGEEIIEKKVKRSGNSGRIYLPPDPQSLRQAQILILEILQCIPAVKIFAFLDLEQNCLFMDGH
ncbi:MAG: DUF2080 family transposase-associated protein [Deltaproteobacteria bacterium]|nr:DUF2080 family transposase-associated protein [Deltaproteobacteria bacterium]